jgi:Holliday junction resolvase RusA-like endonuclease
MTAKRYRYNRASGVLTTMPPTAPTMTAGARTPREAPDMPAFPFFAHDTLSFHLDEPPSANRWWRNVGGRMVTSKAAREYKQYVENEAMIRHCGVMIREPRPVRVHVQWQRGRKSGDLDKRLGVILDALQGVAYDNDSQIVEIHAERIDIPHAHNVIVHVAPAAPQAPDAGRRG